MFVVLVYRLLFIGFSASSVNFNSPSQVGSQEEFQGFHFLLYTTILVLYILLQIPFSCNL